MNLKELRAAINKPFQHPPLGHGGGWDTVARIVQIIVGTGAVLGGLFVLLLLIALAARHFVR